MTCVYQQSADKGELQGSLVGQAGTRQHCLAGRDELSTFEVPARVAIRIFFVNSENLGSRIWRKNCVNYDKIEIAARLRKSHI